MSPLRGLLLGSRAPRLYECRVLSVVKVCSSSRASKLKSLIGVLVRILGNRLLIILPLEVADVLESAELDLGPAAELVLCTASSWAKNTTASFGSLLILREVASIPSSDRGTLRSILQR